MTAPILSGSFRPQDSDGDGRISDKEMEASLKSQLGLSAGEVDPDLKIKVEGYGNVNYGDILKMLQENSTGYARMVDVNDYAELLQSNKTVLKLGADLEAVENDLQELQAQASETGDDAEKLKTIQKKIAEAEKKKEELKQQLEDAKKTLSKNSIRNKINAKASTVRGGSGSKAQKSGSSPAGAKAGSTQNPNGTKSTGQPTGNTGFPSFKFGGGATTDGYPKFDTDMFARAMFSDDAKLDALSSISNSQQKSKKMMLLFMYFARMAMSGDLGAMYQFIKFVNYLISKDKAKQNIDMSVKLIQLQDASRRATELLLTAESPDGTDAKKSNDFMKLMQRTKAEEGVIATSQKLIADMLQEFAQVAEALTNLTRIMLDAWGRALRAATGR